MKHLILEISDSNLAGYSWSWEFYLESKKSGTYTLSCRQIVTEDDPTRIEPIRGLRDGADLYDALEGMVVEAGYSLDEDDLPTVSEEVAKVNAVAAEEFRRAPELLEQRREAQKIKEGNKREATLRPYREIIDRYVTRFSDEPLRYPGGAATYGTLRGWAKRFIEDYVIANGRLPTGKHNIKVISGGAHYSGSKHDFSDLM